MKTNSSIIEKSACLPVLSFVLWAAFPLPMLAPEGRTFVLNKTASAKTVEAQAEAQAAAEVKAAADAKEAAEAKEALPEKRVWVKSIELPDGDVAERKDAAWLGVSVDEAGEALTSQLGLDPGVGLLATFVVPDSPAAKAGLQKNDVLVELQDQALVLPAQLRKLVRARKEGDVVKLKYYRAGKPETVTATLAKAAPAHRMADGGEDLAHGLHLGLLGQLSKKDLDLQMENLKGALGHLKIDQKKIQEEIQRSLEKARQSYHDALRQLDKSSLATDASRRALEELARAGVLMDNKASVTVRNTDKSTKSMVKADDSGTFVIVANPKLHLTAHDQEGKLLFDGEIESDEQRAKVPKEVWEKVEPMVTKLNSKSEE